MVFSKHDTIYWSQKQPSNVQVWDCKDSDKMLCNRFPLKYEVRERGRGEIIYDNVFEPNTAVERPAITNKTDICDT